MELPFPDNYKHKPSKKNNIDASKSEDEPIKPHNSTERLEDAFPDIANEVKNFQYGGIEWPTEFDKFIPKEINDENVEDAEVAQMAWIAKNSAYIATHLQRWMGEKVVGRIEDIYRVMSNPFAFRVMVIIPACEHILNVLPATLPAFQQRFREKYEQLCSVAKIVDEHQTLRDVRGVNSFKSAADGLNEIVMIIHTKARVALNKLTKQTSEQKKGEKAKSQPEKLSGKGRALAVLVEHQDWSDTKIAEAAGISRTTLYDYPEFKAARKTQKQNKEKIPRGSKAKDGTIEAIDE